MPFHKKTIKDLYDAIVTDEVEYRRKLSEIAWNLVTQVGRHSAFLFYFKTNDEIYIYSVRAFCSLCGKFMMAALTCIVFLHKKTTLFYSVTG